MSQVSLKITNETKRALKDLKDEAITDSIRNEIDDGKLEEK